MFRQVFTATLSSIFLVGCSRDVVVKSDLGEVSRVRESTVSSYVINKEYAKKTTREWIESWQKKLRSCNIGSQDPVVTIKCWESFGHFIVKGNNDLKNIPKMPDIVVIKYRTIQTDINGDKVASGYKFVACIPKGSAEDQMNWLSIASNDPVANTDANSVKSNLYNDGSVSSAIRVKVCDKYGNKDAT